MGLVVDAHPRILRVLPRFGPDHPTDADHREYICTNAQRESRILDVSSSSTRPLHRADKRPHPSDRCSGSGYCLHRNMGSDHLAALPDSWLMKRCNLFLCTGQNQAEPAEQGTACYLLAQLWRSNIPTGTALRAPVSAPSRSRCTTKR